MARNSSRNTVLVAGLLGVIWYFSRTASAVSSLSYKVSKFSIDRLTKEHLYTQLYFSVSNPTHTELRFSAFYGDLHFNGEVVSTISYPNNLRITPRSQKTMIVPFKLELNTLVGKGFDALLSKNKNTSFSLIGRVNLNGITYPINETFSLK